MSLFQLYLLFVKIGAFTFGGGYAMIPLFQTELVHNYHFMTNADFANFVALAQVTPGPVGLNAATYIGYLCGVRSLGGFFGGAVGAQRLVRDEHGGIENTRVGKKPLLQPFVEPLRTHQIHLEKC